MLIAISRANFSSSAGFDGFAKETASTGPTIRLQVTLRFEPRSGERCARRLRSDAQAEPFAFKVRDCRCRWRAESTAVTATNFASVAEIGGPHGPYVKTKPVHDGRMIKRDQ